jgi:hypothetical protein
VWRFAVVVPAASLISSVGNFFLCFFVMYIFNVSASSWQYGYRDRI